MQYYSFLKYAIQLGPRPRILGLILMHLLRRRYLLLSVDPSNGCNYKCRMCYRSSDKMDRSVAQKKISEANIRHIIRAFGRDALKLQIGVALDPSIALDESLLLLQEAKRASIKFVSLSTNGVLLGYKQLEALCEAGLDELIISCHGIHKDSYEYFMRGKYEKFTALLSSIAAVKEKYPSLSLRINYTMNADNTEELRDFFTVFEKARPNILQLRPVQDLGSTDYTNYDLTKVRALYNTVIVPLMHDCKDKGITVVVPNLYNLDQLEDEKVYNNSLSDLFQQNVQAYFCPEYYYHPDFNIQEDTYRSYSKKHKKIAHLFKALLLPAHKVDVNDTTTKAMNYNVK